MYLLTLRSGELDPSTAVATPSRVPNGTTCLIMLEPSSQPGGTHVSLKFSRTLYVISPLGHPDLFLRHSNWKLQCDPVGSGTEFNGDATFRCVLVPVKEEPSEVEILSKKLAKLIARRNSYKQQLVSLKQKFENAKTLVQSLKKDITATEKLVSHTTPLSNLSPSQRA
ncbi:hypothetical protein Pmar_PMAR019162 [Perkinsus marinus ATCC 50983]|uniref:Uncharacterized protein n=1 Tax=Perkinsus marinus (strain ATCC 50983 / TXsc) TaxID=423536 RepID=C5KU14_PERM5|nr:hypothetical protein Pmar_PMAR019162 [Perkinsus marinus ATCC 50983]EER12056.1 hypothetical protein Pmar_PMAR019162 [Perkinsus marinus ATCC 50983]|eukprot:XP_002780261.1 hypothetical protein Pmar_PMAR019162 [Perkinsus marinus ATCC 50983]